MKREIIVKMSNNIIRNLSKYLPDRLFDFLYKFKVSYNFYQNINNDAISPKQKRVLISYITSPLEKDPNVSKTHTSIIECTEIINFFSERGYIIDLAHCLDKRHNKIVSNKKYDLIFGFGNPFYLASINNPDAIKIIYLTELHPDFSTRQEKARLDYYYQRHGKRASIKRSGVFFKKEHIDIADYGILMGNDFTAKTFSFPKERLFLIKPTGLINDNFTFSRKDTLKSRKNFIWFGSSGAIHKGLDILIDAFDDLPDNNLFICGLSHRERKLFTINQKNIFDMGFIRVESDEFLNLIQSCAYVILPSCSEGMATSVLTCMNHGLIPIITKECGIDLPESGEYLSDFNVEYIKEKIEYCANLDPKLIETYQEKIFEYSRKNFIIQRFSQDLRDILNKIAP